MNPFNEVKEVKSKGNQELGNKSKGFENTQKDVSEPRHLKTINEELEGKTYPGTDVQYKRHVFRLNGEKVLYRETETADRERSRICKEVYPKTA